MVHAQEQNEGTGRTWIMQTWAELYFMLRSGRLSGVEGSESDSIDWTFQLRFTKTFERSRRRPPCESHLSPLDAAVCAASAAGCPMPHGPMMNRPRHAPTAEMRAGRIALAPLSVHVLFPWTRPPDPLGLWYAHLQGRD